MTSIGSVMPLPEAGPERPGSVWAAWTAGWRNVSAFDSGRAALAALLRFRAVRRVWLPAYACPALHDATAGCERLWYGTGAALAPDLDGLAAGLRAGDAVVGIDYFGRLSGLAALAAGRADVLWIEDRAHALDPGPSWGEVLLYSPRKLVGVAEGGLLVSDAALPTPGPGPVRSAMAQRARRGDPGGINPEGWFPAFQAQEAAFGRNGGGMGEETQRCLRTVAPQAGGRRANAAALAGMLEDFALWPGESGAWLGFPVRVPAHAAAAMAGRGIYCARHWASLPSDPDRFPAAHALSRTLLTLPCDPRYDATDMARVAAALRACL